MAHRSQCSSAGDNPLDPNYLPPHYREEYRMAIDALVDGDVEGYYGFLQEANVVDFLSRPEIEFIKCTVRAPHRTAQTERRYVAEDVDGSSDTYWPVHSDLDAPSLDLGWPQQLRFVGPTEVTTLVNPPDPEMPSIKEQVRRMIKSAQQVVAVVMDMFTDVDIFADILNAAMRGVSVYILLDELNAHHFVSMANNCKVNVDEIKLMRVRTVCGSTYFCHTGKSFKGQMMDRFILVDCRAVLTGNYSFMWSFEKIHRCLAHLFLGQLVTTFDEEFRILYAHSEPLVVEKVMANMSHYSNVHGSYFNVDKSHMFKKDYPAMLPEWADHSAEDHMNVGHQMLPYRNIEPYATEENPSIPRNMKLHATQQFRGDRPFMEHGRQMRGPVEMTGFKKHGYPDVPDYAYMPPQNQPTIRGKQFMEGVMPKGSQFSREPGFYPGAGLQPDYDMYGRFRGKEIHRSRESLDQFSEASYPHEVNEAEVPGAYDHVQRFLQSQTAVEEGHGARNLLAPAQPNLRRQSIGQSYACQTSPTQPNLPDQKRFFNPNRKSQDGIQKQGLRDWRISSYLSAFEDGEEMDISELEGADLSDNVPCFVQEGPCGPIAAEMRPANLEVNRMPSSRNNPPFIQIQNSSPAIPCLVEHPPDLSEYIKITPTTTSESSCTTEGDKVEETQNRKPKETPFGEEFLKNKPARAVQRSSRLRHSLIFSSNLELNTSEDSGEKDEDEASKLSARVSQILDKRRAGTREPFQWSSFLKSATADDQGMESARSVDSLNKIGVNSDINKDDNSQGPLREKKQTETVQSTATEEKSKKDDSKVWQRSSSFMDLNDPDCRLRYFKELAAKRKAELAAGKASQSNPEEAQKKSDAPEKPSTSDAEKQSSLPTPEVQDAKREESSEEISHRATDAEKIRFKKKLAGDPLITLQKDTASALNPAVETSKESKPCTQKPLSGKSSQPVAGSPLKPCSRNVESSSLQNQVDSFALITESATPTQHHIPPCLPVNSSQTKCSPLNITQNESQTPAHQISSTSSNIVDTHLKSKSTPVNTGQTVSTAESSVPQHITATGKDFSEKPIAMRVESSQQPIAKESEPTQKLSAVKAECFHHPTATGKDSSKHPNATEEDSSHQLATAESVLLGTTEQNLSKKPTVMKAESSQQLPVTESAPSQMYTATKTNPFQQPAAGKSIPTATEKDSLQHPPATQNEQTQKPAAAVDESPRKPTAREAESLQKPSATQNEQTQKPNATETESLRKPSPTQNEQTQKPATSVDKSPQKPTATEVESLQKPSATQNTKTRKPASVETESSQKPAAAEAESFQHPPATQNEQTQKPAATKAESLQKPAATEAESLQKPAAKQNKQAQKPAATEAESLQQPSATQNEQIQKPASSDAKSLQTPAATQNKQTQKPAATKAESLKKTAATEAESLQKPAAKQNNQAQKPAATEAESLQKLAAKQNKQAQKPATIEAESLQQPSATQNEQTQNPAATKAESLQKLATIEAESLQQPSATQNEQTQNPAATKAESLQKPAVTEAEYLQKPAAKQSKQAQKPAATEAGSLQNPAATEAESLQQPAATQNEQTQKPASSDAKSLQKPAVTQNEQTQKPAATKAESLQQPSATQNEQTQKPAATKAESLQQPSATQNEQTQKPAATEAESLQQPSATQNEQTQKPASSDAKSLQKPAATEAESLQKPDAKQNEQTQKPASSDAKSLQKPAATEAESLQQPTATEAESLQKPAAKQNEQTQKPALSDAKSLQKPAATEAESLQKPDATQNEQTQKPASSDAKSLQKPAATEAESLQQPAATQNEQTQKPASSDAKSFQKPAATEAESLQKPAAKQNEQTQKPASSDAKSLQKPAATEAESLQKPSTTQNEQTQKPASSAAKSLQKPAATEAESLQQPAATENEQTQKSTSTVAESLQKPATTQNKQIPKPSLTDAKSLQKPSATENKQTQKPAATETESLQHHPAKETNSSQQPIAAESELVQKSTAKQADGFQQSIVIETDSSQASTSTKTDDSQQATAAESQSSELPTALKDVSSQHPATSGHEPSQHLTKTDSLKQPSDPGKDSKNPAETGTDSSPSKSPQNPTPLRLDIPKHAISTECESLQHPTEFKCVSPSHATLKVTLSPQSISFSDTVTADSSHVLFQTGLVGPSTADQNKLIPAVCTVQNSKVNPEKKDENVGQDISKQESIPAAKITPKDNSLHSQSDTLKRCDSNTKSDISKPCPQTDDSKMEKNSSLDQTQTKPSIVPVVKDTHNVITTQLHDSPEPCLSRTQESNTSSVQESSCLNNQKPKDDQPIAEVPTDLHPVQVDETKPELENSVTNQSEVSEKPESTLALPTTEHAKCQSTVAENLKQVMAAHQSFTVNALSCSNLRDDTKVLLEQISAKNQSRASQSKQTPATGGEEKERDVKSAGQQLSSYSGPWSSKASPEEREMLLQKMEKMRKERKVYSRFEAS